MKKYILYLAIVFVIGLTFVGNSVYAQLWKPNPIVLIPGIGASWNSEIMFNPTPAVNLQGWSFTPSVHEYDQLIKSLKDAGLVENQDFFVAFYDWRESSADSAEKYLKPVIDKALAHSDTGRVNIIAHSMGGLVARAYIEGDGYRNDVDNFIMLGTPNRGSSDTYSLWEGGFLPESWSRSQKAILQAYVWQMGIVGGTFPNSRETIQTYTPSVRELLPTYDYLSDIGSGDSIPVGSMHEKNLFLQVLNTEQNILKLGLRANTKIIAGQSQGTVESIPVIAHIASDGDLWTDGKPSPITPERNATTGDGTVLTSSAFLSDTSGGGVIITKTKSSTPKNIFAEIFAPVASAQIVLPPLGPPINQETINAKHRDLPTLAIPKIFSTLGMEEPSLAYDPVPEQTAVLSFMFASPVAVEIVSPSGKSITATSNSVAGATYTGQSDPLGFKMVTIENPEPGEYKVGLTGLGVGQYHMGVGVVTDNTNDAVNTVGGNTNTGEHVAYAVAYDPGNITDPTHISDPVVVQNDPTSLELLNQLIKVVKDEQGISTRKDKATIYIPLLTSLGLSKALVEKGQPALASGILRIFDVQIKTLDKARVLRAAFVQDALQRSAAIQKLLGNPAPIFSWIKWFKGWKH